MPPRVVAAKPQRRTKPSIRALPASTSPTNQRSPPARAPSLGLGPSVVAPVSLVR
jgi:hypothetical protein